MNAKRTAPILTALALALAGCMVMPAETDGGMKPIAPSAVPTAAPTAAPTGGVELTILASGSGVTVLEYQGAGVRCIIASGASVDMVCQSAPMTPTQPTPTEQPKHQVPNGSSEA
jgi:2-keto-3-deoxy-6-phosphogluconate aldolase